MCQKKSFFPPDDELNVHWVRTGETVHILLWRHALLIIKEQPCGGSASSTIPWSRSRLTRSEVVQVLDKALNMEHKQANPWISTRSILSAREAADLKIPFPSMMLEAILASLYCFIVLCIIISPWVWSVASKLEEMATACRGKGNRVGKRLPSNKRCTIERWTYDLVVAFL